MMHDLESRASALLRRNFYLSAAVVPTVVALWWLTSIPPLWFGWDSHVMILWPVQNVPSYPPLYMLFVNYLGRLGKSPAVLYLILSLQHLFLVGATIYLASAFGTKRSAFILSVFAIAGAWFGAFSHVIATQAFDMPFLALLTGVLLRCYANGWDRSLMYVLVPTSIGIALTRHASFVFTIMVPLYWTFLGLIAVLRGGSLRPYVRNTVVGASIALAALVVTSAATDLTCYAYSNRRGTSDCTRIYGRAGAHRLIDTLALIPSAERDNWLTERTRDLPPKQAFAFRMMATDAEPWLGAYEAIKKAYPDENIDRIMNSAFFAFLTLPDRYSMTQMLVHFRAGLSLGKSSTLSNQRLGSFLNGSASTLLMDDQREVRERMGAKGEMDADRQRAMADSLIVAAYDHYTTNLLNWVAIAILLVAMIITRNSAVAALGLAIIATSVTYVFLVTGLIFVVPAYVLPVNFLMYVLTGSCLCILLERWSEVRRRRFRQRSRQGPPLAPTSL
jgi:hypothetical protein